MILKDCGDILKVGLISLGCAKNLVDSEMILSVLKQAGVEITSEIDDSDVVIINTCGFIESAKQETIETIQEIKETGKKLVVCGCYAERYTEKLRMEMPFIDAIVALRDYPKIHLILSEVLKKTSISQFPLKYENRLLATPSASPYVKIAEGCDNRCSYCAIPLIRGRFRSRPIEDIVHEVTTLVKNGAKEINLISQDTSKYGIDLPGTKSPKLIELLEELSKIQGIWRIRLLYLYPDEVSDDLIDYIANHPLISPYFDIPIQHASTMVLKRMLRRSTKEDLMTLFQKLQSKIPHATLRTTLIVGFPGETEEDFQELKSFIETVQFHRLGVFAYSSEEDTPAFRYVDDISPELKESRLDILMKAQKKIVRRLQRQEIGKIHETLIENYDPQSHFYYGRSDAFAPDDIDGAIVFQSEKELEIGQIVPVLIKSTFAYDLIGDAIIQ